MTDEGAHYDDLTEADYADAVEDEARFLAFNDDMLPILDMSKFYQQRQNNQGDPPVGPNIASRNRQIRTVLDRLVPSTLDLDEARSLRHRAAGEGDQDIYIELVMMQEAAFALRARIAQVHQLLGDD